MVVRGPDLVRAEPVEDLGPPVDDAEMGPEPLVRRRHEEVRPERLDIDRPMGHEVDRVDVGQCAGGMGQLDDPTDRIDRPDRVGGIAERDQPGPCRQRGGQVVEIERAVGVMDVDGPDDQVPILGDRPPGRDVRLVVEGRDHDLVARREVGRDRPTQVEGQGGHVRAELDLVAGPGTEEVGHRLVRLGDQCAAQLRGDERTAVVRVRVAVVGDDRIDDPLRDLGSARPVEEHDGASVLLPAKGGELGAQGARVERGHRRPPARLRGRVSHHQARLEPTALASATATRAAGAPGAGRMPRDDRPPADATRRRSRRRRRARSSSRPVVRWPMNRARSAIRSARPQASRAPTGSRCRCSRIFATSIQATPAQRPPPSARSRQASSASS